mmetsp:Transcript_21178/g.32182  ORF Transcript_21178/g.32182 Transcript_21178/m.32182 type:complete len:159 (+) Transcript_21178:144-620(+)
MKVSTTILIMTLSMVKAFNVQISSCSYPYSLSSKLEMTQNEELDVGLETAWRYVKKPLLRIGGKGLSDTIGNSLCELLNAHTAVKVKVNTNKLGSLEDVFEDMKLLVESSGKIKGVELLQFRNVENTIMFGLEGTQELIRTGLYPPPPPIDEDEVEEE